jgi:uncharacterized protein
MPTVLVTGGTGMIGEALSELLLQKGYEVIILTRTLPAQKNAATIGLSYAIWDVSKQTIDTSAVQKADYIVHLAGAGVADKRWTGKRKKEIIESRTKSSELLVNTLKENSNHVKAVISASAIGWYGADPSIPNTHPFTEINPADNSFLGETCLLWEESIEPIVQLGKRLVKLRTGIVLSKDGGALNEFIKPLRFGIAAILGSGKQIISWLHIDDMCRMYLQAIEDGNMEGVYNAVAPKPVSNKELTLHLAKAMRGKFYIPVYTPAFVLKIGLGELSIEVLKSATVSAEKIRKAGFNFIYPSIDAALNQLVGKK